VIFVTIGTSLPFDRLIRAMDALAPEFPDQRFFAQLGNGAAYTPVNMNFTRMLTVGEYAAHIESSQVIVAHAGMGSLITAVEAGKPVVVLPRRLSFGEINTDHQVATARQWMGKTGVHVAMEEKDLHQALRQALSGSPSGGRLEPTPGFVEKIRDFIENG
jgi:UDP-N-acetylglucosamine transferase subunit ALG13